MAFLSRAKNLSENYPPSRFRLSKERGVEITKRPDVGQYISTHHWKL